MLYYKGMTKTKEELEEKLIITELRGWEDTTGEERVPEDSNYEGDADPADTTSAEAESAADTGKKIIDKMRHGL